MAQNEQDTRQSQLSDIRNILSLTNTGRNCIGYQTLSVDNAAVYRLTVPDMAISAEITVEVGTSSTNTSAAARYTINGTTPVTGAASASTHGVPLGDFDTLIISNNTVLNNFKIIAVDGVANKFLRISYFK